MRYRKHISTRGLVNDPQVRAHPHAMQALWRIHLGSVDSRRGEHRITIADYARVSQQACHFCGAAPVERRPQPQCEAIAYNALTRIDTRLPWTVDNIIANCMTCGKMRRNFIRATGLTTATEFIQHVQRIQQNANTK